MKEAGKLIGLPHKNLPHSYRKYIYIQPLSVAAMLILFL
jgi:hypothetical protein